MRWRVAGGGDASSCLLLLGAELAWALAVAELDEGNERVVDTEERELSMIEANALSVCVPGTLTLSVASLSLACAAACVCISSTSTLDSSFLPPPPLRALTIAPSQSCPFLAAFSNEPRHSISISTNVFFFTQSHRIDIVNWIYLSPPCRNRNTSLELKSRRSYIVCSVMLAI
jgi:hypothetical protein